MPLFAQNLMKLPTRSKLVLGGGVLGLLQLADGVGEHRAEAALATARARRVLSARRRLDRRDRPLGSASRDRRDGLDRRRHRSSSSVLEKIVLAVCIAVTFAS